MKKFIWILVISIVMTGIVSAQDTIETMTIGTSYVGEFTADVSSITVAFEGSVGDVVYIAALDNFVPVEIRLLSPNGGQIAQSDNALIYNIELTSDGQYTIDFNRPEWSEEEGEFIAHLGRYELESLVADDADATLTYIGNLADTAAIRQFQAEFAAGDFATLVLFGTNVAVAIQAPNDEFLLFEGVYNDPVIPFYQFPMDGQYTFTVQTSEPGGTDIDLAVHRHDPIPVAINEPVTSAISENLPTVLMFEALAGKAYDINALLPVDGDKYMVIYDYVTEELEYWQKLINQDDGSGPDGQPRIRPFIPLLDGTYHIALWYDDWNTEDEAYEFELTVSPSTLLSIPNNSPLTGEVTEETGTVKYIYTGKAGSHIAISLTRNSEEGAPALTVYSVEDEILTYIGRSTVYSYFEVELPLDGIYEFVIWNAAYDSSTTLAFEILVEPKE